MPHTLVRCIWAGRLPDSIWVRRIWAGRLPGDCRVARTSGIQSVYTLGQLMDYLFTNLSIAQWSCMRRQLECLVSGYLLGRISVGRLSGYASGYQSMYRLGQHMGHALHNLSIARCSGLRSQPDLPGANAANCLNE